MSNLTIYKYPLETTDEQKIEMPKGANILTVQVQNGTPCLWALVNPENRPEQRIISIFGTGNPIKPANIVYIGTYQLMEGKLVLHVFETHRQ